MRPIILSTIFVAVCCVLFFLNPSLAACVPLSFALLSFCFVVYTEQKNDDELKLIREEIKQLKDRVSNISLSRATR